MNKYDLGVFERGEDDNGQAITILNEKRSFSRYITKDFIVVVILAFLMGRASILDGLIPFGIALYSLLIVKERKNWIFGLSVALGIMTTDTVRLKYFLVIGLITIVFRYLSSKIENRVFKIALITGVINFVSGSIYLIFTDFYLYDLFMTGFESVVVFVFIYILSYALPPMTQRTNRKILSNEEVICIAIVTAVAILGLADYSIYGYSLKTIFGILLTLIFAYKGGAALGAGVGVTIGVITSMSTIGTPVVIGIYAFSGLLAGIFKDMGKIPCGLGMILGNSILTFYINGSTEVIIEFEEVLIASLIFILTPKIVTEHITKFIDSKVSSISTDKIYSERIKKLTLTQLKEYSKALSELATTYSQIAEKERVIEQKEVTNIIDDIANSICLDCGMKRNCWKNCFYSTYNGLMDAITTIEAQGQLNLDNIPLYLKKKCLKPEKLIDMINSKFEIYRIDYRWNKKLFEMRRLVSEQFQGISEVIVDLSNEIDNNIEFNKDIEDALYVAFDKERVLVENITVLENERGKLEIDIERRNCYNRRACENNIIPIASKVIGKEVVHKNRYCNLKENENTCVIKLVEVQKYKVNSGVARISKGNISGDSYSFLDLNDNKHMIALSDGMGTGERAAKESMATITLLEQLMEAGFSKNIAIKTINSVLMSKSLDEAFSTIDLSIIDLYTGRAEFIKIGATPSFIKRCDGEMEVIETSSLPAGIINDIAIDSKSIKLRDGDIIVIISDGILDVDKNLIDKNIWVKDILKEIQSRNPQVIADEILDRAIERSNNKIGDDMTVLVTKIWKR